MIVDLFAYSPDAILVVRILPEGHFLHLCNAAFNRLTGYAGEQSIGLTLQSLSVGNDASIWTIIERLCASVAPERSEAYAEARLKLSEQMIIFGELHAKLMPIEGQDYVLVTVRDRSEHKWIEEEAARSGAVVSMLLTTAGTVVSLQSYQGPIRYDRLELSRVDSGQFIVPRDRLRVQTKLIKLRHARQSGEFRFTLQLFQDRFRVHSIVKPYYNGDGSFKCYAIVVYEMHPLDAGAGASSDAENHEDAMTAFDKNSETAIAANTSETMIAEETSDQAIAEKRSRTDRKSPPLHSDASYKLRLLMLERSISVTRLAELTQISLTTISNIRNGKIKKPQRLTAQLIADELGVSPSDIWG